MQYLRHRPTDHSTLLPDLIRQLIDINCTANKAKFLKLIQDLGVETARAPRGWNLINASRKSFTDPIKQISPHSLRHSYCIHLIDLGVSLDKVAKLIGDSIKTTEEYYTGFVVSDNEFDLVKKVIGQK